MKGILVSLAIGLARAQDAMTFPSLNSICGGQFADANATGLFTFDPQVETGDANSTNGIAANVTWAYTVLENATSEQSAIWFSTGGANYANDYDLFYDVCAIAVLNTTASTNFNAQHDNGTCYTAFSSECVDALNALAASTADSLVSEPMYRGGGPMSNLTGTDAFDRVCDGIADALQTNLPKQCEHYFSRSPYTVPLALTRNDTGIYNNSCTVNETFWGVYSFANDRGSNAIYYDQFAQALYPMLTVFLPVASTVRQSNFESVSHMTCIHVDHFSQGSRVSLVPQPRAPQRLTKGAIAGIAIGSVVGLATMCALCYWLWRLRGMARNFDVGDCETVDHRPGLAKISINVAELSGHSAKYELSPDSVKSELPINEKRFELYEGPNQLSPGLIQEMEANDKVTRERLYQSAVAKSQDMLE
ncbi:hypothetical protein LTR97_008814 [Elasticomyces elasticus]|uniref:Uncharacterized protein n=1 Tax=Elasticomyces elasticus TaxID=574655 RepID=A0AAN7ZYB2_9PEZI|nr:hypothetical protein LTR97_008814 [Elasticomyces elasticus]